MDIVILLVMMLFIVLWIIPIVYTLYKVYFYTPDKTGYVFGSHPIFNIFWSLFPVAGMVWVFSPVSFDGYVLRKEVKDKREKEKERTRVKEDRQKQLLFDVITSGENTFSVDSELGKRLGHERSINKTFKVGRVNVEIMEGVKYERRGDFGFIGCETAYVVEVDYG